MAFQVSPGVLVTEKDLTNIVPAVSTSIAGVVVVSEKGPMDEITPISSETEYVEKFGEPTSLCIRIINSLSSIFNLPRFI